MELKTFLTESFNKEYAYRVKIAADCNQETMDMLEQCLSKYKIESLAPWKRLPIQENPVDFVRAKGAAFVSEVCSTDAVFKYPCQPRVLEVWIAANLGLPHERVLVMDVREPRRVESDVAEERMANDVDRYPEQDESLLATEDQEHYEAQNQAWADESDIKDAFYGEAYNEKFLKMLDEVRAEKGADYFRNYPSKDEIMGDNLHATYDELMNQPNMGKGRETTKTVHDHSQQLPH